MAFDDRRRILKGQFKENNRSKEATCRLLRALLLSVALLESNRISLLYVGKRNNFIQGETINVADLKIYIKNCRGKLIHKDSIINTR